MAIKKPDSKVVAISKKDIHQAKKECLKKLGGIEQSKLIQIDAFHDQNSHLADSDCDTLVVSNSFAFPEMKSFLGARILLHVDSDIATVRRLVRKQLALLEKMDDEFMHTTKPRSVSGGWVYLVEPDSSA